MFTSVMNINPFPLAAMTAKCDRYVLVYFLGAVLKADKANDLQSFNIFLEYRCKNLVEDEFMSLSVNDSLSIHAICLHAFDAVRHFQLNQMAFYAS